MRNKKIKSYESEKIKSDSVKFDTDVNGFLVHDEKSLNIPDNTITALKDSVRFIEILDEDGKIYYGGDQDWYREKVAMDGACGTVAAANITAYLFFYDKKYYGLYNYSDYSKTSFVAHMYDVYKYLSPYRIPFKNYPLGIWPMSKFKRGVEKFAESRNASLKGQGMEKYVIGKKVLYKGGGDGFKFDRNNITEFIKKGLESNSPVAMLIGFNKNLKNILVQQPNGYSFVQSSFATHWVTITELKEDKINDKVTVKVSTWGGFSYLDLDDYIDGETVYSCLVYFK